MDNNNARFEKRVTKLFFVDESIDDVSTFIDARESRTSREAYPKHRCDVKHFVNLSLIDYPDFFSL